MKTFTTLLLPLLSIATASAQSSVSPAAAPLPTIDLGYVVQQATINDTGTYAYYNFSNIRYGAPPVGELRFAAPEIPKTKNRTLNDGQQGVICPQAGPAWEITAGQFLTGTPVANLTVISTTPSLSLLSLIPPPAPGTSEDCLFLDVMVPENVFTAPSAKRSRGEECESSQNSTGAPVLVWIYGGGYTGGSKLSSGNPATLISRSHQFGNETGMIFIALNYRLGMFGWQSGPTFQSNGTANAALYDQLLALQWVQAHIHLFGGDPNRVTVMGESAGAGSIMHQVTAFGGLKGRVPFQQAIPQSPGFQPIASNNQQELVFQKTLEYASLITNTSITTVQGLRALNATELYLINYAIVATSTYGSFTFGPTVDGAFAPALPGELMLHGQYDHDIRVMVGHNANEGTLFTSPFITNDTAFNEYVAGIAPGATPAVMDYLTNTLYPPIYDGSQPYTTEFGRAALLLSEASFTCNTRYFDLAYDNLTYSYYFSVPPGLHGEDVAYTFFNGDTTTSDEGAPVNSTVATVLQDYITSFVVTGSPNSIGDGVPYFPMYQANSTIVDLDITGLGTLLTDTVANARCDWWQKGLFA